MDNICEQIVVKHKSSAEMARMALIIAGCVLGAAAAMWASITFRISVLILLSVGLLALGVWYLSGTNVEYEYIITNNEMDIDKIIGKRKRKRMITVDFGKAEDFGRYPTDRKIEADTTVHASSGLEKDARFLLVQHNDYGKVKVIFNPNEKLMEAIAHELPRALSAKLRQNEQ